MDTVTILQFIGALAFGAVIGWVTYFIMRRAQPKALNDITTIIGILGGAGIIALFDPEGPVFGGYAIGLAVGFFGYYWAFLKIVGKYAIRDVVVKQMKSSGGTSMSGSSGSTPSSEFDWGPERKGGREKNGGRMSEKRLPLSVLIKDKISMPLIKLIHQSQENGLDSLYQNALRLL